MTGPRPHRETPGFTLLELLLALSLMALLIGGAYEVLAVARRAQSRAEEEGQLAHVARACMDRMRKDIQSLVQEPSPFNNGLYAEDGETGFTDVHPSDWLVFLTASNLPRIAETVEDPDNPDPDTAADLVEVEYALKTTGDEPFRGLVRRVKRRLNHALTQEEDAWAEEEIAEEVLGLNLRFFDGTEWLDAWDTSQVEEDPESPAYPVAVEVSLVLGTVRFEDGAWTAHRPDGSPTARAVFTQVILLRAVPLMKMNAQSPDEAVVR